MSFRLHKIYGFICLIFFFFFSPFSVSAESISSYDVDIAINTNGSFSVEEIMLYDFGSLNRHGIFRTIPLLKTNADGKQYRIILESLTVQLDGSPVKFVQSGDKKEISIKIGDAQQTITGVHEYVISYVIQGGLTYFSDHDELYWNAIGTEWTIPINTSAVDISLPVAVSQGVTAKCFTGASGAKDSNCIAENTQDGFIITRESLLPAGNGLTVVFGFPKGIVDVVEPIPVNTKIEEIGAIVFIIVFICISFLWYFGLPGWIIYRWFTRGRDPKPAMGVTSAWFDPPKTKNLRLLTPAETGTLVDEKADLVDIIATIIDLARRGFLIIQEPKKGQFKLKKILTADGSHLQSFETILYNGLFASNDVFSIKDDQELITVVSTVKKELYNSVVKEGYFEENPDSVRTRYIILGVFAFITANFPLVITAFTFGMAMPRKTQHGAQAKAVALSLKNFLVSQRHQLKFQAEKQLLFERLLPFAIVFGVEKIWAERFKSLALKQPTWYEGSSKTDLFSPTLFVSHIGSSFVHGMSSSMTPSRSSSGFSSGFSGGGSSGGGGGGGGGGSW